MTRRSLRSRTAAVWAPMVLPLLIALTPNKPRRQIHVLAPRAAGFGTQHVALSTVNESRIKGIERHWFQESCES
jgi:hypothetical protein